MSGLRVPGVCAGVGGARFLRACGVRPACLVGVRAGAGWWRVGWCLRGECHRERACLREICGWVGDVEVVAFAQELFCF